jgi:hypothetical protein
MLSQFASKFWNGTGIKNKINFTYGNLGHLKLESEELTMAVELDLMKIRSQLIVGYYVGK